MFTALHPDFSALVRARRAEKGMTGFSCPDCHASVILKKGHVRVPHFAHSPPITCPSGKGESAEHRNCKEAIWFAMESAYLPGLDIERKLGTIRPDISFCLDDTWIGIEVQRSSMTRQVIMDRVNQYVRNGIVPLWIRPDRARTNNEQYRPPDWLCWLHALYFGRVYYWTGVTSFIQPVHFSRGRSRTFKTVVWSPTLNLTEDLCVRSRLPGQFGQMALPATRLFMDSLDTWWKPGRKHRRHDIGDYYQ